MRDEIKQHFDTTQTHQRAFMEFAYAAASWNFSWRVIARLAHSVKGDNPRGIVTNMAGDMRRCSTNKCYCARGEMENRIKEAQLGLFADRTRCRYFAANQFRLLLAILSERCEPWD